MSSRFGPSGVHQRDPRSALFDNYNGGGSSRASQSPGRVGGGSYGYSGASGSGSSSGGMNNFRPATPNSKGQYSDAVLSELENQNDTQVEGMLSKVTMLKNLSTAIGDEIRDSTKLTEKMNDSFDSARVRVRGTMKRMLRMAEKTGVGWRIWLGFFAFVILMFWYVWLF